MPWAARYQYPTITRLKDVSRPSVSLEIADSTYGSDKAGLVYGYLFVPGQAGRPLDSDEAAEFLAALPALDDDHFAWLHFNFANAASERWLREHLSPPETFLESLQDVTSTRVEQEGDALVAVLNDVRFFAFDVSNVSAVSLWVDRRVFISARITALRSVDRLRASVKAGETFRSPAELLAHLLRDQADVLVQIVRDATKEIDVIEDKLIADQEAVARTKLGSFRRVLVRLRRLLAPEPAALFRLLNRPPMWISSDDLRDLRQSAEELSVAVVDAAALVERIRLLQEEMVALVNERTSRTLFVLTVVTVLALPLTIIPGLFGMNVGGIPWAEDGGGFWTVAFLLTVWAVVGAVWAFRRRGSL
jgi:zinc transporter